MEAKTIQLSDGRKLGYAEYGKPDGVPILYFHGTPGSHLRPTEDVAVAERLGIRLVAPDRPGYGISDFQPDRQFLDWPDDVVELVDALEIERFGVIGESDGAPYVAACAYKIPDRLTGAAMVSSSVPFNALGDPPQLRTKDEIEARAIRLAQRVREKPDEVYLEMLSNSSGSDREVFMRPDFREFVIQTLQEALRNGVQGHAHENLLHTLPWDFALEAITVEIHLWHGELDKPQRAHYLNEHILNCKMHLLPGIGHLIPPQYWDDIFGIFV